MSVEQYITKPDDVECRGWSREGDWLWTIEPLYDQQTGLYARLTYQGALAAAERLGGSLPTRDDIIALQAVGFPLRPVTLPDDDMCRAAGVPPRNVTLRDAFRNIHMGGLEWARIHDERVMAALAAGGWDGQQRVFNAGKHWIAGAPRGRAYLMGWWDGEKWIQTGESALTPGSPGPHDWYHHDCGTTTLVKCPFVEE